jgi:hypothetical protein
MKRLMIKILLILLNNLAISTLKDKGNNQYQLEEFFQLKNTDLISKFCFYKIHLIFRKNLSIKVLQESVERDSIVDNLVTWYFEQDHKNKKIRAFN